MTLVEGKLDNQVLLDSNMVAGILPDHTEFHMLALEFHMLALEQNILAHTLLGLSPLFSQIDPEVLFAELG
jgi:hypothetical protein